VAFENIWQLSDTDDRILFFHFVFSFCFTVINGPSRHDSDTGVYIFFFGFFSGIKGLRGMIATQAIEEGDTIISVPRDLAINLGAESEFPGYAGAELARIRNDPIRR
jgi:hypothetical protein